MALTGAQAAYVAKLQPLRTALKQETTTLANQLRERAEQLLRRRKSIIDLMASDADAHAATYGTDTGLDAELDTELTTADTDVDVLFTTGKLAETREEMEARIFPAQGGAGPLAP